MLMIDLIISAGADRVGTVSTDLIPFDPALREMCEMNSCGMFGKTYTCPPHAGTPEALMKEAKAYKNVTLFQKVYPLEDSFDFEGMVEAKQQFHRLTADILKICRENLDDFLLLGAGGCPLCERCGVQDGIPCRFPDLTYGNLESYCIQVSQLAKLCDMRYINGPDTVTYFGAIFTP